MPTYHRPAPIRVVLSLAARLAGAAWAEAAARSEVADAVMRGDKAALRTLERAVGLREKLEDAGQHLRRDSHAVVGQRDHEPLVERQLHAVDAAMASPPPLPTPIAGAIGSPAPDVGRGARQAPPPPAWHDTLGNE